MFCARGGIRHARARGEDASFRVLRFKTNFGKDGHGISLVVLQLKANFDSFLLLRVFCVVALLIKAFSPAVPVRLRRTSFDLLRASTSWYRKGRGLG